MDTRYLPADHENSIYQTWHDTGAFNPNSHPAATDPKAKSFSIMMPPPNANDPLHVGHAVFISLEDVLIRYHRMLGDDTLWLPGTDHAGIETQFVFEKKLKKEGKSRFNYDRATLYQMIWDYVQDSSGVAVDQMKKLGASADWSRFKFMLDPDLVEIVLGTFERLHSEGLIYRDLRLVNYCTHCGTSFSELEVDHVEKIDSLYYMKYGPFVLATVRPETIFGDTAIAVHPQDKRYQQYIGQEVEVEGLLGTFAIKVIADEYVDPEFGTGVVKITPAHDPNDFEVWQRHQDEIPGPKQVVDFDGKLNAYAGKYAGLRVEAARKQVAEDLQAAGLMEKVDTNYKHSVGTCYRCGRVLEPLPLPQFFVKVKPLTKPVLKALDAGEFRVHGAGHDKILKHWLENLKDWNISRQIVWGIRIPVWYQVDGYEDQITVGFLNAEGKFQQGLLADMTKEYSFEEIMKGLQTMIAQRGVPYLISTTEPTNDDHTYLQETDTFDTWFSSAQWPFSTLQSLSTHPAQNKPVSDDTTADNSPTADDFTRFYPTSVMETGYDILPFWVMRMLMIGKYATGELPFKDIYLHGLIRDQHGKKMSKSKGNVINPLEVVSEFGADALRMALVIRSSAGLDKSVGTGDFKAMRNFTNKIWNAARYVMISIEPGDLKNQKPAGQQPSDFTKHLNQVVGDVTQQLNDFKIGLAAETVYNEFWHWYCDECIEQAKEGKITKIELLEGLVTFLKLLHPFVPFVTEAIWQEIRQAFPASLDSELLISSTWPTKKTQTS